MENRIDSPSTGLETQNEPMRFSSTGWKPAIFILGVILFMIVAGASWRDNALVEEIYCSGPDCSRSL
jgi:hypothetical protein